MHRQQPPPITPNHPTLALPTHQLSHNLLNRGLQRRRIRAHHRLRHLSILEHDESGHSTDCELLRDVGDFVDVQFVVFDVVGHGLVVGEFDLWRGEVVLVGVVFAWGCFERGGEEGMGMVMGRKKDEQGMGMA